MAGWKFEVADWNETGAKDKARAVRDAEAAAMNITLSQVDTAAFDAVATLVDGMVSSLNLTTSKVQISANASVPDSGPSNISLNFTITPPTS